MRGEQYTIHSTNTMTLHQDRYSTAQTYKYPAYMQHLPSRNHPQHVMAHRRQRQRKLFWLQWHSTKQYSRTGPSTLIRHCCSPDDQATSMSMSPKTRPAHTKPEMHTAEQSKARTIQPLQASCTGSTQAEHHAPSEACLDTGREGKPWTPIPMRPTPCIIGSRDGEMAHIAHLLQPVGAAPCCPP
jgi:hypothetical protein